MPKFIAHTESDTEPKILEPQGEQTIAELIGVDDAVAVFLEEGDESIELSSEVEALKLEDGTALFVAKAHRDKVTVTVEYNTVAKSEDWKPQQKVRKVFNWAVGKDGFMLAADQRPLHELAIPGQAEPVDLDTPVGAFIRPDDSVTFELRRKGAFQG